MGGRHFVKDREVEKPQFKSDNGVVSFTEVTRLMRVTCIMYNITCQVTSVIYQKRKSDNGTPKQTDSALLHCDRNNNIRAQGSHNFK